MAWIVLIGTGRVLRRALGMEWYEVMLWMGIPLAILLVAFAFWPAKSDAERDAEDDDYGDEDDETVEGHARTGLLDVVGPTGASLQPVGHGIDRGQVVAPDLGKFPIPPIDLVVPTAPARTTDRNTLTPAGGSHGRV